MATPTPLQTSEATDDEDDESWVPLELPLPSPPSSTDPTREESSKPTSDVVPSTVTDPPARVPVTTTEMSSTAIIQSAARPTTNSSRQIATIGGSEPRRDSVQTLQRRVEMRRHLHQQLVHHPIQMLWSHFLWHMAQEFWNLDAQIRVALLFLLVGVLCKILVLSTWYLWYPKTILLVIVMISSWIYLNADNIPQRIQTFFEAVMDLPNRIPEALEKLDPKQARKLCIGLLFLPTLLQMRTISFLADVNATGGGFVWNLLVTSIMTAGGVYFLHPVPKKAARDVSQLCLLALYGSALWITLQQWNFHKVPSLAGPFFVSTGTILLSYDDHDSMDWFSSLVRYALRLTLRDILATVGTSVQEDEMLQIAILRWLVDYWSYTPPTPPSQSSSTTAGGAPATTNNAEMQWDEFMPMLNVATGQMTSEVHSLQQQQQQQEHHQNNQQPQQQQSSQPSTPAASTTNATASHADDSLHGLQTMLASMNVDDRAKPAVLAYKRNVAEFPPSRQLALVVSVVRRCPACLAFLWQLLIASSFQSKATTLHIFLMLLPLIALEIIRIRAWALGCEALSRALDTDDGKVGTSASAGAASDTKSTSTSPFDSFSRIHPMTILLSGDDDTIVTTVKSDTSSDGVTSVTAQVTIPTLLIVWRNIQSSVSALEVSLTAARVAKTGAVAVDFAQNVMSLAQFGSEVSRHGWVHGLTIIAKEVILDHGGDVNSRPRGTKATFTQAAVSALQNGQVVAQNLQVLANEDGRVGQIVGPIVGLFGVIEGFFHHNNDENNEEEQKDDGRNEEEPKPESNSDATPVNAPNFEAKSDDHDDEKGLWDNIGKESQGQEEVASRADKAHNLETTDVVTGLPSTVPSSGTIPPVSLKDAAVDDQEGDESEKRKISIEQTEKAKSEYSNDQSDVTPAKDCHGKRARIAEIEEGVDNDLADVMEMISNAFELKLIDANEKNEFCLKMSEVNVDKEVVLGMKKTLKGLIVESSHDNQEKAMAAITDESITTTKTNDAAPWTKEADAATSCNEKAMLDTASDDSEWKPLVETVAPDYSERVANAVNQEELTRPRLSKRETGAASTRSAGGGEDSIPTVESSAPSRREEDDNVWAKVGGGLAVLGAVVGGAFLAMHKDNPNNTERNAANDGQENSRSSVTIERLADDSEEGDSWEATAGDSSRQAQ